MAAKEQYLQGKVAIVTGSSKPNGIGAAIAIALAEHGANIIVHYSSNAAQAQEVVSKLLSLGVQAIAVKADAAAPDFGTTLVNAALNAFSTNTIDIIVNNAGLAPAHDGIASVAFEDWDTVFHVNVRGPFVLIQAALPHMPSGGRVINISSLMAKLGSYRVPVYGASKGALNSLTGVLAEELGPKGITVNCVAPGPVATDLSMEGSDVSRRLRDHQLIKREGTPREIAVAVALLTNPDAGYITGQVIPVDGGATMS